MLQPKFTPPTPAELAKRRSAIPDRLTQRCPVCGKTFFRFQAGRFMICPNCGYALRITARKRAKLLFDRFAETHKDITVPDRYTDPAYREKIAQAKKKTKLKESVLTGWATISDQHFAAGIMDPFFIMGSLGSATGEKITRLFEEATAAKAPVVLFTTSGGARMQEGIMSLMQMAKVSAAVAAHSAAGLLYITVLCDPTTGGVTASFAMQGDIILAEPHALVGFAGRRVIEQTIHESLPNDFQRAETVLQHGFIDAIVPRDQQKDVLARLLRWHQPQEAAV
ncbi:acetyl-CoA carboxylase carboxyl transferase subunit beta [Schleiferilactobacillus harbinensis]|jgi:acetyl-CoA carboxylase carboxyl transferase subunit beta|uniref:Acetyl-coenzyme A carboxylase carboxyl transferase subunit beta n=2 Tax=Schleiferilactobacillus harbinensis TaxID=304207 RepID=A0A510TYU7_9LACO|nr:acetyl-CoA carboxylase carboxyltransferase subunit beta [Schleiferilactobacillus harbinensis]KRM29722.1 acetyl-CoA carboxylase [Schleiferilactobacillus harbinensis DSM 16991]MCI1686450.1 acetyl-CoA carboxylase carboxyl transferase subunit beta [Schleiferilactobacillus harbinensis]MCI1782905.1 acetyl-CoA carboxylase carboxyl transferase subunit beta [Schleiferilactobacillus harbinensis]MCI1850864.1 acetyl-CoA carboxylase carboxyl transferase subunit beta [Schleiferilactobacillus harbinensis]